MTAFEYIAAAQQMFARYGFTKCPLSRTQLIKRHRAGTSLETVYKIGCDVQNGHPLFVALETNLLLDMEA